MLNISGCFSGSPPVKTSLLKFMLFNQLKIILKFFKSTYGSTILLDEAEQQNSHDKLQLFVILR